MKTQNTQEILFSNYKEMHSNATFTDTMDQVRDEIILEIDRLINIGYNTFIIGLSDMFDILVAEALNEYRKHCQELQCFVVIYKEQHSGFGPSAKQRVENITKNASYVFTTLKKYHNNAFQLPNEYQTEHLKMSVCYYNHFGDGGVLYTYNRNGEKNWLILDIINLFDSRNVDSPLNTK